MELSKPKGKPLPIGLDPGSSTVKAAQLITVGDKPQLLAAGSFVIPESLRKGNANRLDFMARKLPGMLKSHGFVGNECILSMPAETTFVQHVKVPKGSVAQTIANLAGELHGKLPFPADDAILRYILAGDVLLEGEPRQEVIAVAVPRATLDAYLGMARRAKLDVACVNIEPCGIVECFARLFRRASDATRTTLFIDLGTASTQVVLCTGQRLVFARNLLKGTRLFDEALVAGMGVSLDEAASLRAKVQQSSDDPAQAAEVYALMEPPLDELSDELTQCLRYYESIFRNQRIDRIVFLGGGAYDKRICQALAKRLNLPAQIGDPLLRIEPAPDTAMRIEFDRSVPQPQWAVAVGLSLGATMPEIAQAGDAA